MLSYEGGFSPGFANVNATVPTAAMRNGDFNSPAFKAIKDPLTGRNFTLNQIPAERINPVSVKIQQRFYPLPNYGDTSAFASSNHRIIYDNSTQFHNADFRIDQRVGRNNTMYARVGWVQFNTAAMEGNLPTIGPRTQLRNLRSVVISDTHSFTPQLVNEFRIGYHRSLNKYRGPQKGLEVLSAIGIQGIRNVPDAFGIPVISITSVQTITQIEQAFMAEQMDQLSNAMTWIRGRHTWKMGFDIRREHPNTITVPPDSYGSYSFTGDFTNVAYADFLLGLPKTTGRNYPAPADYRRTVDTGWFIQDDFRLNPSLTVQLGLRYEYETPVTHLNDALYNFDPPSGQLVLVSEKSRSLVSPLFSKNIGITVADGTRYPKGALWRPDKNNFAPRIGLAWRPAQVNDFVIRSGFGVFYDRLGTGVADYSIRGPFTPIVESFTNNIVANKPLFQFPNPFGETPGATAEPAVDAVATNLVNPVTYQYNLSIEKEYFKTGFRVSYIGSKNSQLLLRRNINKPVPSTTPFAQNRRPNPNYREITITDRGGNAHYDSLQIEAKRRFSSLNFNFGYTWANNISDVADSGYRDAGALLENNLNRKAERGRETFAIQHRFVGNMIWQVPIGTDRRFLNRIPTALNHVLGGWETIWTVYLQTGRWFNPTTNAGDPSNTNTIGGRVDRLGNGKLENPTIPKYFDTTAFVALPANAGRFGNCGRNILEGPGLRVIHLGLGKNFRIYERLNLMLEMAIRNLLNHPNFANPNVRINDTANVGRITAMSDSLESGAGRNMQLRLRLSW
jgi:hypothetical protein